MKITRIFSCWSLNLFRTFRFLKWAFIRIVWSFHINFIEGQTTHKKLMKRLCIRAEIKSKLNEFVIVQPKRLFERLRLPRRQDFGNFHKNFQSSRNYCFNLNNVSEKLSSSSKLFKDPLTLIKLRICDIVARNFFINTHVLMFFQNSWNFMSLAAFMWLFSRTLPSWSFA